MRIRARVYPRSSRRAVKEAETGEYRVYTHKPAEGGKANKEVVELIAGHFNVKRHQVTIISGLKARDKLIEIPG
ncbi:MAG: DUF167 domain-containing protein [Candidatus Omnitrophota bacterium]